MHEPKIYEKTICEYLVMAFLFYLQSILIILISLEKIYLFRGVRYTKNRGLALQV